MKSLGNGAGTVVDLVAALDMNLERADDPTIDALRRWQEADKQRDVEQASFRAFETRFFADRRVSSDEHAIYEATNARSREAFDAHWDALGNLYKTIPTSLAGAVLMLKTMLTSDDGTFEHPDIPTGVANVVSFLDTAMESVGPRDFRR